MEPLKPSPIKKLNKFNLPEKIKIGYADYKLELFKAKSINPEEMAPMGETWSQKHVIRINEEQTQTECASTVIHELLHAITYIFAVQFKDEREEERVVTALSNGISTVLRDNVDLTDWIKKTLKQ